MYIQSKIDRLISGTYKSSHISFIKRSSNYVRLIDHIIEDKKPKNDKKLTAF